MPAHRPVRRGRRRHAAGTGPGPRARPCSAGRASAPSRSRSARPLHRLSRRPQRAARSRGAARPAARVAGRPGRRAAAPARHRRDGARHRNASRRAIRAVFGQYGRGDARLHPVRHRRRQRAAARIRCWWRVDWLLRLPQQRCRLNDVRDLLDVPAIANRFGIADADLPRLTALDVRRRRALGPATKRSAPTLGLEACGEQNTWLFGLRRMLLGYASGWRPPACRSTASSPTRRWAAWTPRLAGSLAAAASMRWRGGGDAVMPRARRTSGRERLRALLAAFFGAERRTRPRDAGRARRCAAPLARSVRHCRLRRARAAWPSCARRGCRGSTSRGLAAGSSPAVSRSARLMPMRAIPFEVVCLLGMNDGDYPRRAPAQRLRPDGPARPGRARATVRAATTTAS